jgi:multiphosphoryl transfer protein
MVGLVLVSHSAKLAEGVAELAREMGGEEVRIEPAGGIEDGALGTDAMRVMAAVERAWSDDGVVVLMDLGSAVLSAETALDFLAEEKRDRVVLCEAPFVEGAVAAAVSAKVGASLDEVVAEARRGLDPKAAHLGAPAGGDGATTAAQDAGADWQSVRISVANPLGLHARPAARFVQTAGGFDADVEVENVSTGRGPASARSLNGIATLGVRQGHQIAVRARGRDAAAVLAALRELADTGFGDDAGPPPALPASTVEPERRAVEPQTPPSPGTELTALPVSPGVVVGPVVRLSRPELEVPPGPADDPRAEWDRLQRALAEAGEEISLARESTAARGAAAEAEIFDAHLLFLRDEALLEPARSAIFERRASAAAAWDETIRATAGVWRSLDDDYLKARARASSRRRRRRGCPRPPGNPRRGRAGARRDGRARSGARARHRDRLRRSDVAQRHSRPDARRAGRRGCGRPASGRGGGDGPARGRRHRPGRGSAAAGRRGGDCGQAPGARGTRAYGLGRGGGSRRYARRRSHRGGGQHRLGR